MMKLSVAIAVGVMLVASPVLARTVLRPGVVRHHTLRQDARDSRARGSSIVSVGSTVRITGSGEVVGPQTAIAIVHDLAPKANNDRLSKLRTPGSSPAGQL